VCFHTKFSSSVVADILFYNYVGIRFKVHERLRNYFLLRDLHNSWQWKETASKLNSAIELGYMNVGVFTWGYCLYSNSCVTYVLRNWYPFKWLRRCVGGDDPLRNSWFISLCCRSNLPWDQVIQDLTLWSRSSSKCYLRIQSVPQREHHTSPLQRSTG